MRKTLAIILAVAMIASVSLCFVIGASASDPTPITTAEEFVAMAPDGLYILQNDITISATYPQGTFTGSFNGNGKTITTTVPIFSEMNGTVKNLSIEGSVTGDGSLGALACTTKSENAVFENITNRATVISTVAAGSDAAVGGIIGYIQNNGVAAITVNNCVNEGDVTGPEATGGIVGEVQFTGTTIKNCTNKGKITSLSIDDDGTASGGILGYNGTGPVIIENCLNEGDLDSKYRAGGMIGDARKSATVKNCINTGNVTAKNDGSKNTIAGGIVGYTVDGKATAEMPFLIENCVNTGNIDSYVQGKETGDAAGILGNGGASGATIGAFKIVNCFNSGEISGGYRVGGMIGYVYGSGTNQYGCIENCVNTGAVKVGRFGSQFIGYTNTPNTTIKNSIGAGTMTLNTLETAVNRICVFGCSSAAVELCILENAVLVDGGATEWYTWANSESNANNRIALSYILGKDFSGLTYKYPTYNTDGTLLSADNENTYTNTAELIATNITATSITRAEAITQAMIDAVNTAAGSAIFTLNNGVVARVLPVAGGTGNTEDAGDDTTTTAPDDTTTEAPDDTTTEAPDDTTTAAPDDTTTAAPIPSVTTTSTTTEEGGCEGCSGIAVFAQIIALVCGVAAFIVIKRK